MYWKQQETVTGPPIYSRAQHSLSTTYGDKTSFHYSLSTGRLGLALAGNTLGQLGTVTLEEGMVIPARQLSAIHQPEAVAIELAREGRVLGVGDRATAVGEVEGQDLVDEDILVVNVKGLAVTLPRGDVLDVGIIEHLDEGVGEGAAVGNLDHLLLQLVLGRRWFHLLDRRFLGLDFLADGRTTFLRGLLHLPVLGLELRRLLGRLGLLVLLRRFDAFISHPS
mmetsp:Transcript_26332/g.76009  ORF Transcript_26332/g.76009 Transcript_26332/m.76009 type:complete len:223 (+) Transcript_26332:138-806(+)